MYFKIAFLIKMFIQITLASIVTHKSAQQCNVVNEVYCSETNYVGSLHFILVSRKFFVFKMAISAVPFRTQETGVTLLFRVSTSTQHPAPSTQHPGPRLSAPELCEDIHQYLNNFLFTLIKLCTNMKIANLLSVLSEFNKEIHQRSS